LIFLGKRGLDFLIIVLEVLRQ